MKPFALGFGAALFVSEVYGFPVKLIKVQGCSMQPTLNPDGAALDDWVLGVSPWIMPAHRGDIVTLRDPRRESGSLIKRVVGLAGDVLFTRGGKDLAMVPPGHCW